MVWRWGLQCMLQWVHSFKLFTLHTHTHTQTHFIALLVETDHDCALSRILLNICIIFIYWGTSPTPSGTDKLRPQLHLLFWPILVIVVSVHILVFFVYSIWYPSPWGQNRRLIALWSRHLCPFSVFSSPSFSTLVIYVCIYDVYMQQDDRPAAHRLTECRHRKEKEIEEDFFKNVEDGYMLAHK